MENTGNNFSEQRAPERTETIEGVELRGTTDVSIYYEDTDHSGYVYHANYLKYFERGRSELLSLDVVKEFYDKGVHFVVANASLSYKKPAHYGDKLVVETKLNISKSPRTIVHHEIKKVGNDRPIVTGQVELVLVDTNGRPVATPGFVFDKLNEHLAK